MSTFLALCQGAAQESGVISNAGSPGTAQGLPTTVVGQVGKLARVVVWVQRAWNDIQNDRPNWKWMRREFSGKPTIYNTAKYTPAALGLTSFSNWLTDDPERGYRPLSLYDPSVGLTDEQPLVQIFDYDDWRRFFGRGEQDLNRPTRYAISPVGELCLGPIPDKAYLLRGEYFKGNQVLTGNTDVPECPERFHDAILWRAVRYLCEFDEAELPIAIAKSKESLMLAQLERDQLPEVVIGSRALA